MGKLRYARICLIMLLISCGQSPAKETPPPETTEPEAIPTDILLPTPTDTPTLTETPTPSPTLSPASTQTATPSPLPGPEGDSLRLADFLTCFDMGSVSFPGNSLDYECLPGAGRGNFIAQLDYEVPTAWAGFRIDLDNADFSAYDTLFLVARGGAEVGVPPAFRVEVKRANETQMSIYNVAGLTEEWDTYTVPLQEFRSVPDSTPICSWDDIEELVFVFETSASGERGRVFLDNVYVTSQDGGAPQVPDDCVPSATATSTPPSTLVATTPSIPATTSSLLVADFCSGINSLGGEMGAAYAGNNSLTNSYGANAERDCAARLEYHIQDWAAYWMKLQGYDLTPFGTLSFDIRGDPALGIPAKMKIELKRAANNEISIIYIEGITDTWQTMSVRLDNFQPTGFEGVPPLSSLTAMEELVFTFEAAVSGNKGLVYLDRVAFGP